MGAGKTTVARELARQLDCPAIDLDELITEVTQRSPAEIIEQDGEAEFRELETRMLDKVLKQETARIMAVGGGAWSIDANRQLIAERKAFVVWLDAEFDLCWKRIEAGDELRPLARSREAALNLYEQRRQSYELADARLKIQEHQPAEEIAKEIVERL